MDIYQETDGSKGVLEVGPWSLPTSVGDRGDNMYVCD